MECGVPLLAKRIKGQQKTDDADFRTNILSTLCI